MLEEIELSDEGSTVIYKNDVGQLFDDEDGQYPYQLPEVQLTASDKAAGPHQGKTRVDFKLDNGTACICWFDPPHFKPSGLVHRVDVGFYLNVGGVVFNSIVSMPFGFTLAHWAGPTVSRYLVYYDALESILCFFSAFAERSFRYEDGEFAGYFGSHIDQSIAVCKDISPILWTNEMKRLGWLHK